MNGGYAQIKSLPSGACCNNNSSHTTPTSNTNIVCFAGSGHFFHISCAFFLNMHENMLYTLLLSAAFVVIATQSFAHVIPQVDVLALGQFLSDFDDITLRGSASTTASITAGSSLEIKIINSASDKMYAYITGNEYNNGKGVVYQNGADGWYYPTHSGVVDTVSNNLTIEVGANSDETVTLTGNLTSGRVYIGAKKMTFTADSSGHVLAPSPADKNDANYDFAWSIAELTWSNGELTSDISYVDSVGLALGMKVTTTDGKELYDAGLPAGSLEKVCDELTAVSDDWGDLCIKGSDGKLVRAVAPSKFVNDNTPGSLKTLYDSYIDDVWKKYSTAELTVNTQQTTWGANVTCKVSGDGESPLVCAQPDGKTYNYAKPTTIDVFGCSGGPFMSSGDGNDFQSRTWPRLCAAFIRSTLLLDGGDVTPSSRVAAKQYYTVKATNHFARIVHKFLTPGGAGTGAYAFPFDDVNAPGTGENESGMFQVGNARSIEIEVRGT